jgi:hypothetical protein
VLSVISVANPYTELKRDLDELRRDIANLGPGREIAIGVHPFDPPYEEFEQFYGRSVEQLSIEVSIEIRRFAPSTKGSLPTSAATRS